MLRLRYLLVYALLLSVAGSMYGQSNISPCSAACLNGSGTLVTMNPLPNPGSNLPCGGGTSEDNPLWWKFTAAQGSAVAKFDFIATNCVVGLFNSGQSVLGIQLSIFESIAQEDCTDLVFIGNCASGFAGTAQANILPCRSYYLQLDGISGDRCKVEITYPPVQIMTVIPTPTVNGVNQVCTSGSADFTFNATSCVPEKILWSARIVGSTTSTPTITSFQPHKATINFPKGGIYKVCAQGMSNCITGSAQICKTVTVIDTLPTQTDELTLCSEDIPYNYCNILTKANAAIAAQGIALMNQTVSQNCITIPNFINISNKIIPYTMVPSGCKGKINLRMEAAYSINKLGNFAICEGDSIIIAGQKLDCTNASPKNQPIKVIVPGGYPNCDTTYVYKLFCLKINPSIVPIASLYPTHTSDTLRASAIVSPINTFYNTGTITYKWNTGSTDSKLFVNKPGTYTVSVTYTYIINELPNTPQDPLIKTCTKAISYTVTSAPIGAIDYKCSKIKPYNYNAIVTFSGGNPPFYANNKIIKQKYFSIPNIPNGQSFTQTFKDNNGQSFTIKGSKICTGKYLQAQDKATEMEAETMESAPNIEILDNKIVNLNEDWRIENITIYNLQGQRLCAFDNTENLDLQACMAQYPTSMYIIKTTLVSEEGEKRMIVKKLSVGN